MAIRYSRVLSIQVGHAGCRDPALRRRVGTIRAAMVKKSFSDTACSLAQAQNVVGEWWSMLIIRDFFLGGGRRRFEQLRDSLQISRNILTDRLKTLTDARVIERVPLQEGGKRCAYQLTEKGRDLLPALLAIIQWWDKWERAPEERFMKMRDRERNEEVAPVSIVSSRGEPLTYSDLVMTVMTPRGETRVREWPLDGSKTSADDLVEPPGMSGSAVSGAS